jgi:hypothetical protein
MSDLPVLSVLAKRCQAFSSCSLSADGTLVFEQGT